MLCRFIHQVISLVDVNSSFSWVSQSEEPNGTRAESIITKIGPLSALSLSVRETKTGTDIPD